jgi:hypothetical protein
MFLLFFNSGQKKTILMSMITTRWSGRKKLFVILAWWKQCKFLKPNIIYHDRSWFLFQILVFDCIGSYKLIETLSYLFLEPTSSKQ